jgi:hypothetical protein
MVCGGGAVVCSTAWKAKAFQLNDNCGRAEFSVTVTGTLRLLFSDGMEIWISAWYVPAPPSAAGLTVAVMVFTSPGKNVPETGLTSNHPDPFKRVTDVVYGAITFNVQLERLESPTSMKRCTGEAPTNAATLIDRGEMHWLKSAWLVPAMPKKIRSKKLTRAERCAR